MNIGIATLLINWFVFYFYMKNEKFYPAMYKFYWTLVVIFIPFSWILYLAWGRKAHTLKTEN